MPLLIQGAATSAADPHLATAVEETAPDLTAIEHHTTTSTEDMSHNGFILPLRFIWIHPAQRMCTTTPSGGMTRSSANNTTNISLRCKNLDTLFYKMILWSLLWKHHLSRQWQVMVAEWMKWKKKGNAKTSLFFSSLSLFYSVSCLFLLLIIACPCSN